LFHSLVLLPHIPIWKSPLCAVSGDEVLDDAEDALLLMPGEPADFCKDAAGFADRASLFVGAVFPSEAGRGRTKTRKALAIGLPDGVGP
jgi:hypothetical protein